MVYWAPAAVGRACKAQDWEHRTVSEVARGRGHDGAAPVVVDVVVDVVGSVTPTVTVTPPALA